jgi:transcription elongation GreA/GreB family factor
MDRKSALKAELVALLRAELATAEGVHRATVVAATHEEAKPENDKDTRALEQSYLARGQAARVDDLRTAVAETEAMPTRVGTRAVLGAIVTVTDEDDVTTVYWIAPHGGGSRLEGGLVQVVTPRSPLGRALIGKVTGDDAEVVLGGKTRGLSIVRVS